MPIKLDFSNSKDAMARIQQFLMYDQLNKRGAQRQQTQSFLEDALMRGREESRAGMASDLEEQRSGNTMKEATHTAMLAISQAPQFDGILSILNLGRMGKLPPGSERLYEDARERFPKMWEDIANGAYAVSQGTATAEHFAGLIEARGSEAAKWAAQEGGMHLRAKEDIRVQDEIIRIRKAEQTAAGLKASGEYSPYEEQTLKRIDVALNHIVGEGVETDNAALQANLNSWRAGTGKATDVFPSDVAGYFKSELDKMKSKIIHHRKELTEMEDAFISGTFNVFEARGGYNPGGKDDEVLPSSKGGIPPGVAAGGVEGGFPSTPRPHIRSPQTGLSPDSVAGTQGRAREDDINKYINDFLLLKHPGRDPNKNPYTAAEMAAARERAEEWVNIISGRSEENAQRRPPAYGDKRRATGFLKPEHKQ